MKTLWQGLWNTWLIGMFLFGASTLTAFGGREEFVKDFREQSSQIVKEGKSNIDALVAKLETDLAALCADLQSGKIDDAQYNLKKSEAVAQAINGINYRENGLISELEFLLLELRNKHSFDGVSIQAEEILFNAKMKIEKITRDAISDIVRMALKACDKAAGQKASADILPPGGTAASPGNGVVVQGVAAAGDTTTNAYQVVLFGTGIPGQDLQVHITDDRGATIMPGSIEWLDENGAWRTSFSSSKCGNFMATATQGGRIINWGFGLPYLWCVTCPVENKSQKWNIKILRKHARHWSKGFHETLSTLKDEFSSTYWNSLPKNPAEGIPIFISDMSGALQTALDAERDTVLGFEKSVAEDGEIANIIPFLDWMPSGKGVVGKFNKSLRDALDKFARILRDKAGKWLKSLDKAGTPANGRIFWPPPSGLYWAVPSKTAPARDVSTPLTIFASGCLPSTGDDGKVGFGGSGDTTKGEIAVTLYKLNPKYGTWSEVAGPTPAIPNPEKPKAWSITFDGLAPGTYKATATQGGNSVTSAPITVSSW